MGSTDYIHLSHRGVLSVSGPDAEKFLQGILTQDIRKPEKVFYSLLLSPRGRFLHEFFILKQGPESYLILPELQRIEDLKKRLALYKLRAQVLIQDVSSDYTLLWTRQPVQPVFQEDFFFPDTRCVEMGGYCLTKNKDRFSSFEDLQPYRQHHLQLGMPDGSLNLIIEKDIPLENNFDQLNGISWDKGCYVGQELTARTKHMAEIRKRLFPVEIRGNLLQLGSSLCQKGQEVGVFKGGIPGLGLAQLRTDKADLGQPFYDQAGGFFCQLLNHQQLCGLIAQDSGK